MEQSAWCRPASDPSTSQDRARPGPVPTHAPTHVMTDPAITGPTLQRDVQLHTKNGAFVADPVGFLLSNPCTLSAEIDGGDGGGGDFMTASFGMHAVTQKTKEFRPRAGLDLTVQLRKDPQIPAAHRIVTVPRNGTGKRVAFLPWRESKGACTQLDANAELFLTGPLSGCHIYVAVTTGQPPWVFHINANDSADDKAANIKAKDDEADAIAATHGTTIVKRIKRGEYEIPAFVWGVRIGNEWSFYVHELQIPSMEPSNRPLSV